MKNVFFFLLVSACKMRVTAQNCRIHVSVLVQGIETGKKLSAAVVAADSGRKTLLTDGSGRAVFTDFCSGTHNLTISFTGYEAVQQSIEVVSDTSVTVLMNRTSQTLRGVVVAGTSQKKDAIVSLTTASVSGLQLLQTRGNTLGESLKSIPGLNSLQTGPGLSKPIIHGLHGNRVLILNNGIRQEGQQWGSEHAPEIDPFIASKITVIKGAAGVRYGSDAIAGVILLDPEDLEPKKSFEGSLDLVAATNGRLGVVSSMIQGNFHKIPALSWRLQGTLKQAGNFSTPHYFLDNSGLREKDYSGTLSYRKASYGGEIYYSSFFNRVGIFSGSHVGNITDLFAAFKRDRPIVNRGFSYAINRTFQKINHDLLKITGFYNFQNRDRVEVTFSTQNNLRDEYDIDLPYTTDPEILKKPQISFKIGTQQAELVYELHTKNHLAGSFGFSGSTQGNVFNGIRYLIPNFRNYTGGAFALEKYSRNKLTLEAGVRYDYRWLRVYQLNNTTLQTYHTTTDYKNVSGTIGATYRAAAHFSINANAGSGWRAPSINELYINGIHLSAASYERGDSTLQNERSYDFTVSGKYESDKLAAELVLFDNVINNFIYAKPSLQPIQLISGTYPFFAYTQANVNLKGFDVDVTWKPVKKISILSKTALLRGWNKTINDYLIFLPADKFDNSISRNIAGKGRIENIYYGLQNISVLRQTRVPPNSDYVPPPPGYSIFNLSAGFTTHVARKSLSVTASANNVLNSTYRDYLNRFRYYADDLGINFVLRTKLNF